MNDILAQIIAEITEYCGKECCSCGSCPEEICVLFRIEKIIERGVYEKKGNY